MAPPPRAALVGLGSGLVLMALFTLLWSALAPHGWHGAAAVAPPALGAVAAVVFLAQAARLFRAAPHYPSTAPEDAARERRAGIAFGITFGAEGAAIAIAANVLAALGLDDYTVPVIALIVGPHFYPMARIFDRTVDYWIATWVTVTALMGIVALARSTGDAAAIWSAVGTCAALGTGAYGVYMWIAGRDLLRGRRPVGQAPSGQR